ncbi:MAG TPA: toll/interleukin-1 receptor domain-containing protein [Thermoanaerobaculia bacterium]
MALFFLSYRRATAGPYAGRLSDRLVSHFGEAAIFYDRGRLSPGELWQDRLLRELKDAAAVLAVIDTAWASSFEARAETEDFVRFEIETALGFQKTIVPLLVGGAQLPDQEKLPLRMQQVLDRQFLMIDETSDAGYTASVATLIGVLESLDALVTAVEPAVAEQLLAKDYAGAERLLMRQPAAARQRAILSVYLAFARLGGRSFNALYPAERETIEMLLRRARASSPTWDLPLLLLAILEIDYYQLHGLVSAAPVRPAEVLSRNGTVSLDAVSRSLLSHLNTSQRARRELQLDAVLEGAQHD